MAARGVGRAVGIALGAVLIGAPTSAREPNASAKPFALCDGELPRLRDQALKPENAGAGLSDWDHAIVVVI